MLTLIKREVEWLNEHAEQRPGDKIWVCKKTKEPISNATVGRSIWIKPFTGGSGEVRQVVHLACMKCTPNAEPPNYGTPIYEDELVETEGQVHEATSASE